jgi:tripartite-type tricarboxylate transporter receptor subunit TctC
MHPVRKLLFAATLTLPATMTAAAAKRDAVYPTRPVRILVPQSPGGTTDLTARLIAPHLAERFGQPIVVDNRPGAGSLLGTELAARAAPDGYTLLVVGPSFTVLPNLYKRLPFDPVRDFAPITTLSQYPNVLLVHPSLPVKNVKELIALAKARPGEFNFASGGAGTGTHLGAELFRTMAGLDIVHVPYKGGGPALNALMAGQVQLYFAALPSTMALLRTGKLRPLAVTSPNRASAAPELPTIAESGLPGFEQITWNGMLAPARTPRTLVERIRREAHAVISLPASRERFAAQGAEIGGLDADAFAALIKRELAQWARVIKQAGIKAE